MNISLVIPTIRTHLWPRLIASVEESCKKYEWEIIFVGPFDNDNISDDRVKFFNSHNTVPVSLQIGFFYSSNKLIFQTVDDCVFLPDAIDICIDFYIENCGYKDIVNMRYSEGINFAGHIRNSEEWKVKNCPEFHLPYINMDWGVSVQPLISSEYLKEMGGLDCRWEYSNHSHHDFIFRCQQNGSKLYHSPVGVSRADHMPMKTGDHAPIHDAQMNDIKEFNRVWSSYRPSKILFDDFNNYKGRWTRRFSKEYSSYKELVKEEGYKI